MCACLCVLCVCECVCMRMSVCVCVSQCVLYSLVPLPSLSQSGDAMLQACGHALHSVTQFIQIKIDQQKSKGVSHTLHTHMTHTHTHT